MNVARRNNVHVSGSGDSTVVFAHGYGCDQSMWRYVAPQMGARFRTVCFDLVGSGGSDVKAYDFQRYGSLHAYAEDLLDIIDACAAGPVIYVGHSVSAMIGMLATIKQPHKFAAQVMVGPSPCYINDGDYVGGYNSEDIAGLLGMMDDNYDDWAGNLAPAIMGAPGQPDLAAELTASFRRTNRAVARHFARVTFTADHRADVPQSRVPALVLQCSDDMIAPREVGEYMHRHLPVSSLAVIDNVGHCPHMSSPGASMDVIDAFLARTLG
jgi:sigma-B regulation protein RsbQ